MQLGLSWPQRLVFSWLFLQENTPSTPLQHIDWPQLLWATLALGIALGTVFTIHRMVAAHSGASGQIFLSLEVVVLGLIAGAFVLGEVLKIYRTIVAAADHRSELQSDVFL